MRRCLGASPGHESRLLRTLCARNRRRYTQSGLLIPSNPSDGHMAVRVNTPIRGLRPGFHSKLYHFVHVMSNLIYGRYVSDFI